MEKVYARPKALKKDAVSGFCPGCMHGTVTKLIAEVLEELDILDKTVLCLRDRHQTDHAGDGGFNLPGRRRPGLDRPVRDDARGQPGREHLRDFYQQRHLRHDGRSDGADHAGGHERDHRARRARSEVARLSDAPVRDPQSAHRAVLPGALQLQQHRQRAKNAGRDI